MEYGFVRHDIAKDREIFVLTFDQKKQSERILIGTEIDILSRLNDSITYVIYDKTSPIGNIFMDFKQDIDNEWYQKGFMPLWKALHTNRWKQPDLEKAAATYLQEQYSTGNPLYMFAAIRVWNGYLRARLPRDRNTAAELYRVDMDRLLRFFSETKKERLFSRDLPTNIKQSDREMKLEIWYPKGLEQECVVAYAGFEPILMYYNTRLNDLKLVFRQCKMCGRIFLAKSLKNELCSDKCRRKQGTQNKRSFDERARDNGYDHFYKNETQHWRNLLSKAKRNPDISEKKLQKIKSLISNSREEALMRKNSVKDGSLSEADFETWMWKKTAAIEALI